MFVAATWPLQTWTLPLHDVDQLQPVASLELRPGPLVVLYSYVKRVVIFAVDSKHIQIRIIIIIIIIIIIAVAAIATCSSRTWPPLYDTAINKVMLQRRKAQEFSE